MKKNRQIWSGDLLVLKWPVLLLFTCLVCSSVLIGGISWLQQRLLQVVNAEKATREQLSTSIQRLEEDAAVVRGHSERYGQLAKSGILGEENRLELVAAMEDIRQRYRLYPLQFDIDQQVEIPLKEGEAENVSNWLSLRSSRLRIRLPLLHEGDLAELYKAMQGYGKGLFVADECLLERVVEGKDSGDVALKENLNAACTILWLTLQPEKETVGAEGESAESQQ